MVSIESLKIGVVYKGNTALMRKIVGFYKVKMGRRTVKVNKPTDGNTVKYIRVDQEGNEIGGAVSCEISTFIRWADEAFSINEKDLN